MRRKVTRETVMAFLAGYPLTIGNTHTDGETLYLHGNAIARKTALGIEISDAGWKTSTTKERLNGLLEALRQPTIYQKRGEWYRGENDEWLDNEWQLA